MDPDTSPFPGPSRHPNRFMDVHLFPLSGDLPPVPRVTDGTRDPCRWGPEAIVSQRLSMILTITLLTVSPRLYLTPFRDIRVMFTQSRRKRMAAGAIGHEEKELGLIRV